MTVSVSTLPAFADNPKLRLFLGTMLYLAQGFPQGLFFVAIPTWLAANDQPTEVVAAAAAAASLPWSFKFIAGLVMDRYTWLPMGRRRPWLVGSQFIIALSLIIGAIYSLEASQTALVLTFVTVISIATAIQDVALDAMVVDLTPDEEKGRMNGFMFGGKVIGIAGGMAITSYLLEHYGFSLAMLGMLTCFGVPAITAILIRERDGEKLLPWSVGVKSPDTNANNIEWGKVLRAIKSGFLNTRSHAVVLMILVYGVHQGLSDTTDSLFAIRQLGWTQSDYSTMAGIFNIVNGIFCLTIGGLLVDRYGPGKTALVSGILGFVIMGSYVIDTSLWVYNELFIIWYAFKSLPLFVFYLANLVLAMRVAVPDAAATSFATYMALGPVGFTIAAALLPVLEDFSGFQAMYGMSAILVGVAGLMSLLLTKEVR